MSHYFSSLMIVVDLLSESVIKLVTDSMIESVLDLVTNLINNLFVI